MARVIEEKYLLDLKEFSRIFKKFVKKIAQFLPEIQVLIGMALLGNRR